MDITNIMLYEGIKNGDKVIYINNYYNYIMYDYTESKQIEIDRKNFLDNVFTELNKNIDLKEFKNNQYNTININNAILFINDSRLYMFESRQKNDLTRQIDINDLCNCLDNIPYINFKNINNETEKTKYNNINNETIKKNKKILLYLLKLDKNIQILYHNNDVDNINKLLYIINYLNYNKNNFMYMVDNKKFMNYFNIACLQYNSEQYGKNMKNYIINYVDDLIILDSINIYKVYINIKEYISGFKKKINVIKDINNNNNNLGINLLTQYKNDLNLYLDDGSYNFNYIVILYNSDKTIKNIITINNMITYIKITYLNNKNLSLLFNKINTTIKNDDELKKIFYKLKISHCNKKQITETDFNIINYELDLKLNYTENITEIKNFN